MYNSTTMRHKLKGKLSKSFKFIFESSNTTTLKYATDVAYGLLNSGSGLISDIARELNEAQDSRSTCIRLYRNSLKQDISLQANLYVEFVKEMIDVNDLYINVDLTEIVKIYGKQFEALGQVIDGKRQMKYVL